MRRADRMTPVRWPYSAVRAKARLDQSSATADRITPGVQPIWAACAEPARQTVILQGDLLRVAHTSTAGNAGRAVNSLNTLTSAESDVGQACRRRVTAEITLIGRGTTAMLATRPTPITKADQERPWPRRQTSAAQGRPVWHDGTSADVAAAQRGQADGGERDGGQAQPEQRRGGHGPAGKSGGVREGRDVQQPVG